MSVSVEQNEEKKNGQKGPDDIATAVEEHQRRIDELEALEDFEITIKYKETIDTVLVPNGKRMTCRLLGGEEVLWSPASNAVRQADREDSSIVQALWERVD